ncbi:MAG: fused response regulator/phosphatase, partial [Natronospirillum sp.]
MTKPLRILIADDSQTDRMILAAIIRQEGHFVLEAEDGFQAVDQYRSEHPDLILMDAMMPGQDGMEAARIIKSLAGDELVPIIFLTSLQDADSLAECLESGGDDFLSKPYQRVILHAKIKAFGRMRTMHAALQENHNQLLLEQEVARKVYDTVTQGSAAASQYLRTALSSKALFNGDTVLAHHRPDGGLHVFVGDFTGHGLPAAIGALPLADTFYGMTQKGFELEEIVREMNSKLMRVLPVHLFCCGALLHLDLRQKMARLWVGGLPDCLLLTLEGTLIALSSDNLPLGVKEKADQPLVVQEFPMQDGERLFIWSDGIIEASNNKQEMFGEDKLRAVFA